jgi:flagellar FliL protein
MAGNKPRVLQAELTVMTRDQAVLDAITTHAPIVRNRLIDLLSKQDFVEMQTDGGRKALMEAAKASIDGVLEEEGVPPGVEQVLLVSFVMQ